MSAPFQVMPPLTDDEYADLRHSIARDGILSPVLVDQHGRTIDGHHRLLVAEELGLADEDIPREVRNVQNAQEARSLAYSLNLHRRHLTRDQRRELVAASLRRDPDLSDREHGRRAGVSHVTAAAVRDELESTGQIDQLEERTGADGKTRPAKVTRTSRTTEATKTEQVIDLDTGEIVERHDRAWAVALFPDLDVAGAPDAEVVRVAEGVLQRPTHEHRMRSENGAKWLAAYVRRGGPVPYTEPASVVAARDMESLSKAAVMLGRDADTLREAWDAATGFDRSQWAGIIRSLSDRLADLQQYIDAAPTLRSIK